ncbi:hypothetical protein HZB08_02765, partial [Candidatus Saganbacteria bacterium]|nr:hypothetical protein [Candidatus Saganbacteria bacterium]
MATAKKLLLSIFGVVVLISAVVGGVPDKMSYEGRLTDSAGNPITSVRTVEFRIFDAPAAGNLIWGPEAYEITPDNQGVFSVLLGTFKPLTKEVFDGAARFIEITVGKEILTPRTQVVSVGYAFKAAAAQSVDGGFVKKIIAGSGVSVEGDEGEGIGRVTLTVTGGVVGPQGPTGEAGTSLWVDGSGKVTTTVNVGIGTAEPGAKLEIYDSGANPYLKIKGTGDNYNFAGLQLWSDETADKYWSLEHRRYAGEVNNFAIEEYDGTNYNQRLVINPGGKVGVGTTGPTSLLTVAGTVEVLSPGRLVGDGSGLTGVSASLADGSVTTAKIADGAVTAAKLAGSITDDKLSAITTAEKVSGAALTSLGNIPAGAGTIPTTNIDTGTTANKIIKLDSNAKLPAVDGSQLTNVTLNTSGTITFEAINVTPGTVFIANAPAGATSVGTLELGVSSDGRESIIFNPDLGSRGKFVFSAPLQVAASSPGITFYDPTAPADQNRWTNIEYQYSSGTAQLQMGSAFRTYYDTSNPQAPVTNRTYFLIGTN